jgi:aminoglycoside 3-N-acetyltransferase I
MTYTHKQLTTPDGLYLRKLLKVFGDAFLDKGTYHNSTPSDVYLRSLLSKPHFITLVTLENDEVIGGLTAYILEKFEQERKEIYVYDLAVAQPYRRQGIATALINELKSIAKKRNAYVIFVHAEKEDAGTIKLYELLGKKKEVLHFDIAI